MPIGAAPRNLLCQTMRTQRLLRYGAAMALSAEVDEFVKVASASLPRVSEIISAFSDEERAGAFELAERRYAQAARDFGCDESETKRWVTALMRKLRALVIEADRTTSD